MRTILMVLVMVILVAAVASAQDVKPFNFYAGAGLSLPNGDFSDGYGMGLHGSVAVGFNLAPGFQVAPKAEFHTFKIDGDVWSALNDGAAVEGGTLNSILAGADIRFNPPLPAFPMKPFLFAGGGYANLSVSDLEVEGLPAQEFDSEGKFYWNIGAGVEFGNSPFMSFFVQARYLAISTDMVDYNMIPVTVGIKF